MHFGFDDDQVAVRDTVAGFLEKRAGLAYLQEAWQRPDSAATWAVWPELAGMGVHGMLIPESAGGTGFDWVTMALVLAEAGRVAFPLPLSETAAVGLPLLVAAGDPAGAVPGVISGREVLTMASSVAPLAPAASRAGWFILAGRAGPVLYRRDDVEIVSERSVDRTRDLGRVTPRGAGTPLATGSGGSPVNRAGPGPRAADHGLLDTGALAAAATLIGLGRALIDITLGYVKQRNQFGVPVGSFQAVKHHLADAAMQVEFAAPAVWAAAYQLSHPGQRPPAEVSRSVSLAKAMASDAASLAARKALQCHGAMGYTDDYHLHMWLKRVWCLAASYGSAADHRRRIGATLGVDG